MPWTLYRYILRELLKVLVLTTAVLVVVLSFGAAIGPLADGLLGPATLVKFVLYTMPTVLGFALPFAGAFSATVVFHSMVKDNEILACRAGGMSYSKVFAPVLGLGLALMFVLLLLSNTIVPGFWKAAKRTVEGDVLGVLVSQLNQNRPYVFHEGGLVLYADHAWLGDSPPGEPVDGLTRERVIGMRGVAVGQFDQETGNVLTDTTATTASAELIRDELGNSYITLRLEDPVYFDAQADELQTITRSEAIQTDRPMLLPDPLADEAMFFTFQELMQLKRSPQDFDIVREAQAELAATVAREHLKHLIVESLTSAEEGRGYITLMGGLPGDYYGVSAPLIEAGENGLVLRATPSRRVTVSRFDNAELNGEPIRKFEADYAELQVLTGQFSLEPEVLITMRNVTAPINKAEYRFARMGYPEQVLGVDPATLTPEEVNEWSQHETIRDSPDVQMARAWLRYRIIQLKYMIDAEFYVRFATSIATPLLLLLGCLLAVRFRDKLPLVVFFWAFLLAIITLVMIHTGHSMAQRISIDQVLAGESASRLVGVGVLWGGNLMLLVITAKLYLRVSRN